MWSLVELGLGLVVAVRGVRVAEQLVCRAPRSLVATFMQDLAKPGVTLLAALLNLTASLSAARELLARAGKAYFIPEAAEGAGGAALVEHTTRGAAEEAVTRRLAQSRRRKAAQPSVPPTGF